MKRWSILILIVVLVAFVGQDASAQCSQCKLIVENQDVNMEDMGNGLNTGILYLMAIPYLLLFIFFRKKIFKFFREFSKAKG